MSNVEEIRRCISCLRMGNEVEILVQMRQDGVFVCGDCVAISASIILDKTDRFPNTCARLRTVIGGTNVT